MPNPNPDPSLLIPHREKEKTQRQARKEKVLSLYLAGKEIKDIAAYIGLDTSTVDKYITELAREKKLTRRPRQKIYDPQMCYLVLMAISKGYNHFHLIRRELKKSKLKISDALYFLLLGKKITYKERAITYGRRTRIFSIVKEDVDKPGKI